jgi:hypothetical protein
MYVYVAKYFAINRPQEALCFKLGKCDDLFERNKSLNPLLTPHRNQIIKAWKVGEESLTVESRAKIHFINHKLRDTEEYFNKQIIDEVDNFMSKYEIVEDLDVVLTTDTRDDPEVIRLYNSIENFEGLKAYIEKKYNQGFALFKQSENVYLLSSGRKVIIKKLGVRKEGNTQTQLTDSNIVTKKEAKQIKNWRKEGKKEELIERVNSADEALLFVYNCSDNKWVALTTKELLCLVPYENWDDESLGEKNCKKYTHKCHINMQPDHLQVGPLSSINKRFKFKLRLEPLIKREFNFAKNERIDLTSIVMP